MQDAGPQIDEATTEAPAQILDEESLKIALAGPETQKESPENLVPALSDALIALKLSERITFHEVDGVEPTLDIHTIDAPGPGGAHHDYIINGRGDHEYSADHRIRFQRGSIKECGVNGLTNEVLLAIVAHRLSCFQDGPFPCHENETALSNILAALGQLNKRTKDRIARGVEGQCTE